MSWAKTENPLPFSCFSCSSGLDSLYVQLKHAAQAVLQTAMSLGNILNPIQAYFPYTMQICLSSFSIKYLFGLQVVTITFYA